MTFDSPRGPENSDVRPARTMAVRDGSRWIVPAEPVWTGALLAHGVAWVRTSGELVFDDGVNGERVLDHDVIPELAVSPSGRVLAYAKRPGATAGVYVWDGERSLGVTYGLSIADRPMFLDETRLVVVGARASGIAGVWIARTDVPLAAPIPVTNATLRTGHPLGDTFVPPPADHASMHVEDGALVYFDGRVSRRVVLPQVTL